MSESEQNEVAKTGDASSHARYREEKIGRHAGRSPNDLRRRNRRPPRRCRKLSEETKSLDVANVRRIGLSSEAAERSASSLAFSNRGPNKSCARRDSNPRSQPSEGRALSSYATCANDARLFRIVGREWGGGGHVLEEIELVIDETAIEFTHAVGMTEEIRTSIGKIVAGRIRNIVRYLDFFHLAAIDRMRTEIAGNR